MPQRLLHPAGEDLCTGGTVGGVTPRDEFPLLPSGLAGRGYRAGLPPARGQIPARGLPHATGLSLHPASPPSGLIPVLLAAPGAWPPGHRGVLPVRGARTRWGAGRACGRSRRAGARVSARSRSATGPGRAAAPPAAMYALERRRWTTSPTVDRKSTRLNSSHL